jgi:hypothetical protein
MTAIVLDLMTVKRVMKININKNMKKIFLIFSIGLLTSLVSCGGGETCYYCSKDSYWNGISYTDPGPYANNCREDGESDEEYKARIKEKVSNGYTCKEK